MAEKITIKVGKEEEEIHGLRGLPGEAAIGHLEKTLVLMLHGFPGHKAGQGDLFGTLEGLLLERGFHTLRFDFRGCGESDGKEEEFTLARAAEDLRHVLHWAKLEGYEHFIMAGEGLGASIALLNANMSVSANLLFWPALDLPQLAKNLRGGDAIAVKPESGGYIDVGGNRIGHNLLIELAETDMVPALKEAFAPALVMHGAEDILIPSAQLDVLRKHIPSKRVEITVFHDGTQGLPDPRHRKMVYYHILQFLEKYA